MERRKELSLYLSFVCEGNLFLIDFLYTYWPELCYVSSSSLKSVWVSIYQGKGIYTNWPGPVMIHPLGLSTFLPETRSGFYYQGRRGDGCNIGVNHVCSLGNSRCYMTSFFWPLLGMNTDLS